MGDAFSPIKGKCMWWREQDVDEDIHDIRLTDPERRVRCWCFVEGKVWVEQSKVVPADCPDARHCRYYIKNW